jgi:hypothetical protein
MQGKKTKCSNEGRKKNYLARRRLCVTGGAAAEAGGGVVAHGWRLQAALRLFRTSGGVTAFFSSFLPVSSFSLSLPMFRSSFFLPFPLFSQSVFFFRLLFFMFFSPLDFSLLSVLPPFLSFSSSLQCSSVYL